MKGDAMKRILMCVVCVVLVGGCSLPANPKTEFNYGPVRFYDSKDNDVEINNLTINPETGMYSVEKLTIRNNASDVRRANVEQIQAYTEQVKAMAAMTQSLANTVGAMIPYFKPAVSGSINTPYGGGSFESTPVPSPKPADVVPPAVGSTHDEGATP
jgi:hypothetical protein